MTGQAPRIQRNYHSMAPTRFHGFNQKLANALYDEARIPPSIWAANPTLLPSYRTATAKHDAVYHESMLGSRLVIAEREVLQAQLVILIDEIASLLEMAAVRSPDVLLASGFDLTKERRGRARAKASPAARVAAQAEQNEGGSDTSA